MNIKELIESLPEVYQPIFGYNEFDVTSRHCLDRLEEVSKVIKSLKGNRGKQIKILDLGCAQGFFSLSLAELGYDVTGVDFLEENINVCNFLANENSQYDIQFFQADAIEFINEIEKDQFDIVLGFSLFHHLIAEKGLLFVQKLLGTLAEKTKFSFFELAVKEEPVYWAEALPEDDRQTLNRYRFTKLISRFETHLSHISRPMYFASNFYTLDRNGVERFNKVLTQSHKFEQGAHCSSRSYYLADNYIMKVFDKERLDNLNINVTELLNEKDKLNYLNSNGFEALKLISFEEDPNRMYLKRTIYNGELLSDVIESLTSEQRWDIFDDILGKLSELESLGLYVNDLRPWNIIVTKNLEAKLIDYGSISSEMKDCSNPSTIFASFVLFVIELFSGKVSEPDPVRTFKSNLDSVPISICNALANNFGNYNEKNLFLCIIKELEDERYGNKPSEVTKNNNVLSCFIEEIRKLSTTFQYCLEEKDKRYFELKNESEQLVTQLSTYKFELDLAKSKITELEHLNNIEQENYERIDNELNIFKKRKSIRFINLIVRLFRNA